MILLLLVAAGMTAPAAALGIQKPVPDFSAGVRSGAAPLTVSFTDHSLYATGWAWYFGDESYNAPWTKVNAAAGWTARSGQSSVVLPDGSIVLMGGTVANGNTGDKNDVWRSTDNGSSWMRQTPGAGWTARTWHSSVVMPDGSIVLMGGYGGPGIFFNDVWRSTDKGKTWNRVNTSVPGWTARAWHSSVALTDGTIVLMGGNDGYGVRNDTWRSTDNGATWTLANGSSGWRGRVGQSSVVLPDSSIVLMGGGGTGGFKNDVWRSTDKGATWVQMTAGALWSARDIHTSAAMPDGSIVLMGGYDGASKNDVWRSTDKGATWTRVTPGAGWTARHYQSSVVLPDGSISLMGGTANIDGTGNKNDVWRFMSSGSSVRNPSHTYTKPGIYSVTLQAYNTGGYNSTRKIGYITVVARPAVTAISPTKGSTAGGTRVTITGTGFTGATAVRFGTTAGTSKTVNSSTKITVTSPAHAAGIVNVTVTTPGGTSALSTADRFTYVARPTVTGISPTSGPHAGGTRVTVTGTGFTGSTAVNFGAPAGASLTVNSSTKITVTSPAHAAGIVNVTVTTPGGTSALSTADRFTYT